MDRKEFFRASLGMGAACVGASRSEAEDAQAAPPLTPCEERADFARIWVKRFMDNFDEQVGVSKRLLLMEARGRSCARGGAVGVAKACNGDVDKLVTVMAGWLGKENVRCEGSVVRVAYDRCLCPMVADVKEISGTYCDCSRGWLKEMFEAAGGKSVKVEVLETIKRGGSACRFTVHLEA